MGGRKQETCNTEDTTKYACKCSCLHMLCCPPQRQYTGDSAHATARTWCSDNKDLPELFDSLMHLAGTIWLIQEPCELSWLAVLLV
eukprot:12317202-Alexandrium_andersonii.AAC.1